MVPINFKSSILFDASKPGVRLQAYVEGVEGRAYKDGKAISEKGRGSLTFENAGCLKIARSNTQGKFEIKLRPQGPGKPSFEKRYTFPPRLMRINCEAQAEGGNHTLRFLLKDEEADEWLAKMKKLVEPGGWVSIEVYLWADSTKDFLFRIDDIAEQAPSFISIRNLTISEQSS